MVAALQAGAHLDAVVVGGGPAGLYTARGLAAHGLRVRVFEEHSQIGQPVHCTGILGREAFDLPGVPSDVILGRPNVASFRSPRGHEVVYAGPADEVVIIDRGAFDLALARRAADAGAEIATDTRVVDLDVHGGGVRVCVVSAARRQVVSASVCVLACGARYQFQRSLGLGMPPMFLGSAQTELIARPDATIRILLHADLAPSGFGWLAPLSRQGASWAKVGVMASVGARRALYRLVDELAAQGHVIGRPHRVVARLLPLSPIARTFGDRILAVGDAAGLVKPTTGGGIYYSLLSAGWAVDTIRAAFARGEFSACVLSEYERTWRARLGRELRVGTWFRRLAGRLAPGDLDSLTRLAVEDGLMPLVEATAQFNWHHKLILQAVRHPGVLQILVRRMLGGAERGDQRTEPIRAGC